MPECCKPSSVCVLTLCCPTSFTWPVEKTICPLKFSCTCMMLFCLLSTKKCPTLKEQQKTCAVARRQPLAFLTFRQSQTGYWAARSVETHNVASRGAAHRSACSWCKGPLSKKEFDSFNRGNCKLELALLKTRDTFNMRSSAQTLY